MKTIFKILFLAGIVGMLAGCGNPTDRESNPLLGDNGLTNDIPLAQAQKNGHVFCQSSYSVTIRTLNDQGAEVDVGTDLSFLVGEAKIYHIYVESRQALDISLAGEPDGMDLTKINSSRWDLHWQPTSDDGGTSSDVRLIATSLSKTTCGPTQVGDMHVTANTGSLQPTISVTGIDTNKTYGPKDRILFMVNVVDPTLTADSKLATPTFQFPNSDASISKASLLKAKDVVQCGPPQALPAPWTFQTECAFNVNQVIAQNPKAQGLGISEMQINVKSTLGEAANPYPVKITVQLPTAAAPSTGTVSELENKIKSTGAVK